MCGFGYVLQFILSLLIYQSRPDLGKPRQCNMRAGGLHSPSQRYAGYPRCRKKSATVILRVIDGVVTGFSEAMKVIIHLKTTFKDSYSAHYVRCSQKGALRHAIYLAFSKCVAGSHTCPQLSTLSSVQCDAQRN